MNKLVILIAASALLVGCEQTSNKEGAQVVTVESPVIEEPPMVEDPMDSYRGACAEIGQTRMFEGSKRVDILKTVGGLSSQQAATANQLIEEPLKHMNQKFSAMKELADAFNSMNVREIAPGLMTPKCYDEALVLNENLCMLAVLAAVEGDDPNSEKLATGDLTMRFMRIAINECENQITGSIISTL